MSPSETTISEVAKSGDNENYTVHWCPNCKTPVIAKKGLGGVVRCPRCDSLVNYFSSDLRPVFPEERLLLGLLEDDPDKYIDKNIWANNSRYFLDGKSYPDAKITNLDKANSDSIALRLHDAINEVDYSYFEDQISVFCEVNSERLNSIVAEAFDFINQVRSTFADEDVVVSFSGGKDSTVTANLVVRAMSNPSVVHVFGDTTLEFPTTYSYVKRFRESHPRAIFRTARNNEQVFQEVAKQIGPPARMMRWCCSMFKTGPISRTFNGMYKNRRILTFYGIRKCESVQRSHYNRVEDDSSTLKIGKQKVASPIFEWKDIDVWLYLLSEGVDFNDAYRFGYDRVGCWCCPNNNHRAELLSSVYMPSQSKDWHDFLVDFAREIGKPDPENYIDEGGWKARQGGNGLAAAKSVKVNSEACATEDNARVFKLLKPYSAELENLFVPFGKLAPELGRKLLHETVIVDVKTRMPILSIQPFDRDDYEYAVKVRMLDAQRSDALWHKVEYQIRKFNACRRCLKCEALCKSGAISLAGDSYYVDPNKCTHCWECMTNKYLRAGCLMDKYLGTKDK